MATPDIAKSFYDQRPGDTDTRYVSPQDAKDAIDKIYLDLNAEIAGVIDSIEIGETSEEVLVGPTGPTLPNIELWIDTDEDYPGVSITGPTGPMGPAGAGSFTFGRAGDLAVVAGSSKVYAPGVSGNTLTSVRASVGTAPTGNSAIIALMRNGSTLSTITIPAGSTTSGRIPVSYPLTNTDYLTVNIIQVGSTVAGSDLTIQVEYI